jgi:hypothetical protein
MKNRRRRLWQSLQLHMTWKNTKILIMQMLRLVSKGIFQLALAIVTRTLLIICLILHQNILNILPGKIRQFPTAVEKRSESKQGRTAGRKFFI